MDNHILLENDLQPTLVETSHHGNASQTVAKQTHKAPFDERHVLHELAHFLPSQSALKDFIHHNSLHAYQHLKFYPAIFKASNIFGYHVTLQLEEYRKLYQNGRIRQGMIDRVIIERKGHEMAAFWKNQMLHDQFDVNRTPRIGALRSHWKSAYKIDLDYQVHPLLFRVLSSYLDQGIALWRFPTDGSGFLSTIRALEQNGIVSFFKTKRAKGLLLAGESSISDLLKMVAGDEAYFEQYLFDQQFSHQGWSGFVATAETTPEALLDHRKISLQDLVLFELLLEIDALDHLFGSKWQPLSTSVKEKPMQVIPPEAPMSVYQEVLSLWQDAFEWSYYDQALAGIERVNPPAKPDVKPFQALFCIDERECSLRRHVESVAPGAETLGAPGFFGVEFYFQQQHSKFYEKLCPAPVTPKYLIKETEATDSHAHELLYTRSTHTLLRGAFFAITMGFWAACKIVLNLFRPKMSPAISNAFAHMDSGSRLTIENKDTNDRENGLQIGFTVEEMATRVENLLRGIGAIQDFSPLFYVIAHGSSSANNPHHGAHDCGACSGRPGGTNARVFAFMANHPRVRERLRANGIDIPDTTQFVGAMHDTAADQIGYYDEYALSKDNAKRHQEYVTFFENALDLNAKERSRRFASIDTRKNLKKVRKAILDRSVSLFEPRPELGHGTNTLCIVGRRELTQNLFLDRRAFLNSYDYRTDPEGKILQNTMRPLGPVCGGINLEYYFSRVDNYKLGAGTKLPHNVVGLFGVANSSDGDLRPGLPLQMIEVHDPVRLLIVVEHFPEVVLRTIQSAPEMYEWFINEWVHIVAVNPETRELFKFREGEFVPYQPLTKIIPSMPDFTAFIENAKEMETNHILHATTENLPVYTLN